MLIAAFGDIHDRVENLDAALERVAADGAETILCTGDVGAASLLPRMAGGFPGEIHLVLGNIDDELEIKRTIEAERLLKVYYHQLIGRLTFDKKHVAFTHKPKDATALLEEQRFDVVFYGHTHEAKTEQQGKTLLVNPGDLQGRFGATPSYALYDTATSEIRLQQIT